MRKREVGCPGFQVKVFLRSTYPNIIHSGWIYTVRGPQAEREYEKGTGKPETIFCDHGNCQPHAEYEYVLIEAFAKGLITKEMWIQLRPPSVFYRGTDDSNRKPWCAGKKLAVPVSEIIPHRDAVEGEREGPRIGSQTDWEMEPYFDRCTHEGDSCNKSTAALFMLCALVGKGIIPHQIVEDIQRTGWGRRLDQTKIGWVHLVKYVKCNATTRVDYMCNSMDTKSRWSIIQAYQEEFDALKTILNDKKFSRKVNILNEKREKVKRLQEMHKIQKRQEQKEKRLKKKEERKKKKREKKKEEREKKKEERNKIKEERKQKEREKKKEKRNKIKEERNQKEREKEKRNKKYKKDQRIILANKQCIKLHTE